jgi:DNA repair exonuclease SbcCD ATPase subunit
MSENTSEATGSARTSGQPLSCDMQQLMERLSEMTEKQERYQNHLKAARIVSQAQSVEERRTELEREEQRLAEDLADSPFASVEEAEKSMLSVVELAKLTEEIRTYREEYAATIARCVKPQV